MLRICCKYLTSYIYLRLMRNVSIVPLCKFILPVNYLIFSAPDRKYGFFIPFHRFLLNRTFKEAVKNVIYGVEFGGRIILRNEIESWRSTCNSNQETLWKRTDNWSWKSWSLDSGFTLVSGVKTYFFTQHTFVIRFHPSNQSKNHKQTDEQMFFPFLFHCLNVHKGISFYQRFGSWKMRKWLTRDCRNVLKYIRWITAWKFGKRFWIYVGFSTS